MKKIAFISVLLLSGCLGYTKGGLARPDFSKSSSCCNGENQSQEVTSVTTAKITSDN